MFRKLIPCNVGLLERAVRLAVGAALLVMALEETVTGVAGFFAAFVGGLGLISGATGYCPLNAVLGRDTCEGKEP